MEGRRLRKREKKICGWADAAVLVSQGEADMLAKFTRTPNVYTITNGVDLDYYSPSPPHPETGCVFVGALDYFPNVDGITWFTRTVWPNVRVNRPKAPVWRSSAASRRTRSKS